MAERSRPLRLLGVHARLNLLLLLRSRQQAITYLLADLIGQGASVVAVLLLAARFDGVAGWSRTEILFLAGYGLCASGLETLLFSYNLAAVSRRIGRGQLDHSLLQPQRLITTFLTEGFAPVDGAALVIPGGGLMVAAAVQGAGPAGPGGLLALVVALPASVAVLVAFNFIWGSLAFWAPQGAEELSPAATGLLRNFRQFPFDPLSTGLKAALVTVIPAGHLAWLPSASVIGRAPAVAAGWTLLAAVISVLVATAVFQRGMSHYARTGSQRYSDFGHRR